ncbi:MAG: ribonucleotide-diphosphate reductase subunit alpha, partial [Thermoplasmata archaeon]|nr:ribonucleotide-diphosphate reductase subunit alpha [Thermoplasmata archaeon]
MAELTLTETAMRVLRARYLLKDREGRTVETPEGMFRRVARTIALADAFYFEEVRGKPLRHVDASLRHVPPEISERLSRHMLNQLHRAYVRKLRRREVKVSFREFLAILAERWDDVFRVEEEFYDLMTSRRFLPNSPTLMNAGAPLGQLSACFVIPVEDSIEGIMDALALAAKVQKSGGGTGFSFSRLRPEGDIVHSTGGQASGPVSFMKLFDTLTEVIKQGGKRRGANMGVLDVHHPDIEKFITCKADGKSFQNFNISVAASDEFMEAVIHGRKYPLINPRTGEVVKMEDARYIWNLIVQNAWRTG